MATERGLDADAIAKETGTILPEREALSLIDPTVGKVALSSFAAPDALVDAPLTAQGGEQVTPE